MNPETKEYLDNQHKAIFDELTALKLRIEPIARIYDSLSGFGATFGWFAKMILVPISLIVGIWYELTHGTGPR